MARHFTRVITTPAAARMVRDWSRPFVSLLSDFGSRDPSAGIMRGVVLGISPDALVIDVSHDVDKFAVTDGALLLWCALPYLPIGAHVAVVDPGVGTQRRGVALETARGDYLVGPDNGLLIPGAARLGGIVRAHLLQNAQYRLPVVSSSFHGRDLFAPAAAHLAMGVPLETLGPPLSPRELITLGWPEPIIEDGSLTTNVIYVDTFGNVKFAALAADLHEALGMPAQGDAIELRTTSRGRQRLIAASWADTFGNVPAGETLLYEDSYGRLCLAVNQGSAAQRLKVSAGTEFSIRRPARHVGTGPTLPTLPTFAQLAAPEDELSQRPETVAASGGAVPQDELPQDEPSRDPEVVAASGGAVPQDEPSRSPEVVAASGGAVPQDEPPQDEPSRDPEVVAVSDGAAPEESDEVEAIEAAAPTDGVEAGSTPTEADEGERPREEDPSPIA